MTINSKKILPNKVHSVLKKYILADGMDVVLDLEKSRGSRLYDSKRGKYFLDLATFHASLPLGYNHPYLASAKSKKDLLRSALHKPSNPDLYTVELAEFVQTFGRVAKPSFMKYIFFTEGGSLAVENALKAAFDWKVRLNLSRGKGERGLQIIHFKQAFHGRGGYTVSLTNTADPRKYMYFPKFQWPRVTNPKITFPLNSENLAQVKNLEEKALTEINEALKKNHDDIAAILLEPIQGEGGDNHFRAEFHQALSAICDQNDILLIHDEVQTGFALTGKMWAHEHYGVRPDLIAFGKKFQACGFMAGPKIDKVKDNVFKVSSRISSTWGGSLTDMVRGRLILEAFEKGRILKHVKKMAVVLSKELRELELKFPGKISNVRTLGLMAAFDLPDQKTRDLFIKKLFASGVIILASGEKSVRFRPTLTVTEKELTEAFKVLRKVLQKV